MNNKHFIEVEGRIFQWYSTAQVPPWLFHGGAKYRVASWSVGGWAYRHWLMVF